MDYLWIIIFLKSHSDCTHLLQRIHWWASDVKLQICSDDETNSPSLMTYGLLTFNFWANYSFKFTPLSVIDYISLVQIFKGQISECANHLEISLRKLYNTCTCLSWYHILNLSGTSKTHLRLCIAYISLADHFLAGVREPRTLRPDHESCQYNCSDTLSTVKGKGPFPQHPGLKESA